jgi:cytochrome c553
MTPPPPPLAPRIGGWTPAELFWIVRHGVKFTGMPAWPAQQREDEVWAVVAFLLRLPDLPPNEYLWLAFREPDANDEAGAARLRAIAEPIRDAVVSCERCHGADGLGRLAGAFPRLAGQRERYLAATLAAYAEGTRFSGIMQPIAAALDAETREALARHFSRLARGPVNAAPTALPSQGERLAKHGVPERKVAACIHCHGPGGGPRNPYYPELAGQYADYLATQIRLFVEGDRGGTAWAQVMEISAHYLSTEETAAVAAYYAALPTSSGAEPAYIQERDTAPMSPANGLDLAKVGSRTVLGRGPSTH